jgi:hypothetical protein
MATEEDGGNMLSSDAQKIPVEGVVPRKGQFG